MVFYPDTCLSCVIDIHIKEHNEKGKSSWLLMLGQLYYNMERTKQMKLLINRLIEKAEVMNLGMFIIKNGKVVNLSNDITYKISDFVDMVFNETLKLELEIKKLERA